MAACRVLFLLLVPAVAAPPSCLDEGGDGTSLLQTGFSKILRQSPNVSKTASAPEVNPDEGVCLAGPLGKEVMERPISELLEKHPGEDGWCLFGALGTWVSRCAACRRKEDCRSFAASFQKVYDFIIPRTNTTTTLRLPDGRSLALRDKHYPLDDMYCWVNGWYDLDREAAVNNYTYLSEVSAAACRSLEQTVPNYSGISMQMMYDESDIDNRQILNMVSKNADGNVSQAIVDGMRLHAATKCLMSGGRGGLCDIANCAMRGCRLNSDTLGYHAFGDCPPV
mmetsp:Transcript_105641/g.251893  ORF Transcript_105641/g.251893 Transcript_105641/m.251893 type:complete len:281 (+) Transcript_105641:74-916(+)|eukprot:CAMPEP_0181455192 /NCGR_PEP_ID=MMETSP1110-20121109/30631_1 /TAXON_ID=174948 /ORGANISM="Symbiodinium sp., Strain CCMP421" /LENGTH=280 /DNA_ID=CAMNT_0023579569 /DNA_START=74 /DNA_END=913 /DNA_ORIENTATION=-